MFTVAGLSLGGCAVGVPQGELPSDLIAITYWEPEPARRRAEIIEKRKASNAAPAGRQTRVGVARVTDIGQMLGGASEDVWETDLRRFPGRLMLLNPRSGELFPVPEVPPGAVPLSWSGDHERLLYVSNHREKIQLYEYNSSTREIRKVTHGKHQHIWGDYGHKKQLAVLQVGVEKDEVFAKIYVTDDAGGRARVVLEEGQIENMRLFPDGKTLVYVHHPVPDRPAMVAIDLESGEHRPLGPGREPSISRAGGWIVYSAKSRNGWRLRRVRADGSARSPAGAGIRDEKTPSVSPDGRLVVYVGESLGVDRLFVRRLDGTGNRILLDAGGVFSPVW
jgi:Tol biopolymer transport system component